ncbi:uncharacterized protein LOC131941028 [Physella acuta]|uniref:uncharacterized protein LOC131941028 n=1 Tax=Physella acuta TaxID=109671 RepID=UPI0027DC66BD|nr:uncharacterized protein LOC131941028 [Physella acuta]
MKTLEIILFLIVVGCAADRRNRPEGYEGDIFGRFPGYFYTKEEINNLLTELNMARSMETGIAGSDPINHACCSSTANYTSFEKVTDINGRNVTLVKVNNRSQYFLQETCTQSSTPCTCKCKCKMMPQIFTAIVENTAYSNVNTNQVMLALVKVDSICRCINNAPPPPPPHTQDTTPTGVPDTEL